MKKKIVSLLLTLTMAAGLISGCGSSSSSGTASTGSGGQTAENMEEAVAWLSAKGIETEPVRTDDFTGKKMTFFFDPDGLPLELHE